MKSSKLEKSVQAEIIRYIIKSGNDAVKIISPSRRGCPDIMAIVNGRIFLIETKRKNKDLSGLQEYFFSVWNKDNVVCLMADSLDMFKEKARQIGVEIHGEFANNG